MYPTKHAVRVGTNISLGDCKTWNMYKWIIDDEGKIANYEDKSLCIQMSNVTLTLRKCADGRLDQRWIYSSNGGRIVYINNLRKRMVVANNVVSQNTLVNVTINTGDKPATYAEMWMIKYDSTGLLSLPSYNEPVRIVSDLSSPSQKWCLYPAYNAIADGTNLAISICKDWKTYQWMMDLKGRIVNMMDTTMCIEQFGKWMKLSECHQKISQRWAYSVLDKKLVALVNGQQQATVQARRVTANGQVQLLAGDVTGPSYQRWEFGQV